MAKAKAKELREVCKRVFSKENKLFINYKKDHKSNIEQKQIILCSKEFQGEPEKVSVCIGTTISPKEFESIRIDYYCEIHHEAGNEFRQSAFDLAKATCLERLEEDVCDLHSAGMIKDHYLLPKEEGTIV